MSGGRDNWAAHRWPDGSRPYEREPEGWRKWADGFGIVHHIGVDGWCWEHSGDRPAYCGQPNETILHVPHDPGCCIVLTPPDVTLNDPQEQR